MQSTKSYDNSIGSATLLPTDLKNNLSAESIRNVSETRSEAESKKTTKQEHECERWWKEPVTKYALVFFLFLKWCTNRTKELLMHYFR